LRYSAKRSETAISGASVTVWRPEISTSRHLRDGSARRRQSRRQRRSRDCDTSGCGHTDHGVARQPCPEPLNPRFWVDWVDRVDRAFIRCLTVKRIDVLGTKTNHKDG
jgi:hypothetical protein